MLNDGSILPNFPFSFNYRFCWMNDQSCWLLQIIRRILGEVEQEDGQYLECCPACIETLLYLICSRLCKMKELNQELGDNIVVVNKWFKKISCSHQIHIAMFYYSFLFIFNLCNILLGRFFVFSTLFCCGGFIYKTKVERQVSIFLSLASSQYKVQCLCSSVFCDFFIAYLEYLIC